METGLTKETERSLLVFAHAFNGYGYAREVWQCAEEQVHPTLEQRLRQVQETGKMFLKPADSMATNFYLHRSFHHIGWLPPARSKDWYTMLFFYLHLYRIPIPAAYQFIDHSKWLNRLKGSAEAAAAEIRLVLHR